ncbi:MAG: hypothetical protein AAGN35_07975 [Bacteroidota bacterium]
MKKLFLLSFWGALILGCGCFTAHAQSNTNVGLQAAKEAHNAQRPDQYDAWKRSVTRGTEIGDNVLVESNTNAGFTTHTVQLGYNIPTSNDAVALENKIQAQPGVSSVSADYTTNRVTIVVKEEDEHDALKAYFDIE